MQTEASISQEAAVTLRIGPSCDECCHCAWAVSAGLLSRPWAPSETQLASLLELELGAKWVRARARSLVSKVDLRAGERVFPGVLVSHSRDH